MRTPPTRVALLLGIDVVHVAAMSVWIGGVAFLVRGAGGHPAARAERAQPAAGRVVARFSTIALVSVAALLASGIAAVDRPPGVLRGAASSAFGRAILVKVALMAC